jgi:hypothetical protein
MPPCSHAAFSPAPLVAEHRTPVGMRSPPGHREERTREDASGLTGGAGWSGSLIGHVADRVIRTASGLVLPLSRAGLTAGPTRSRGQMLDAVGVVLTRRGGKNDLGLRRSLPGQALRVLQGRAGSLRPAGRVRPRPRGALATDRRRRGVRMLDEPTAPRRPALLARTRHTLGRARKEVPPAILHRSVPWPGSRDANHCRPLEDPAALTPDTCRGGRGRTARRVAWARSE